MSLFPAYSENDTSAANKLSGEASTSHGQPWLENRSFVLPNDEIQLGHGTQSPISLSMDSSNSSTPSSVSSEEYEVKNHKKHKKKKHKRYSTEQLSAEPPQKVLEFANEAYYVDKSSTPLYKNIQTLHKPACPLYRKRIRRHLGWRYSYLNANKEDLKARNRYYRQVKAEKLTSPLEVEVPLEENEYTLQLGQLNRNVMISPHELQYWLDLIQLQHRNPYKWSRFRLAERKVDIFQRALVYHPRCERLYRVFMDTVNSAYPSEEISRMYDKLLAKDPYNYTLWSGQIITTQGSMMRCVVPDVLKIYERSMQKMHHAQLTQSLSSKDLDAIMLKLFNNCALFLRQAGLHEQFMALLKLALELNVSNEQFGDFAPSADDERTLIEYEELIVQSGLPMNELWLRVQKLRQSYNFLPVPASAATDAIEPQRVVLVEDVCHYIYPLKSADNAFYLMLLILRLLKFPFVQCDGLADKFCARVEEIGDSDAIEDVLAACLRRTYALPLQQDDAFLESLCELCKEMTVCPSFLSNNLGHEIYSRYLSEFIKNCAATQANDSDERRRIVFITLWCRFERVLLLYQRFSSNGLTKDYVRAGRARFKALLKQPNNRNVLNFYTEFALYEFEAKLGLGEEDLTTVHGIFENIIVTHAVSEACENTGTNASDLCYTYLVYAELLIGRGLHEEALQVLTAYVLSNVDIRQREVGVSAAKKLSALQQLTEKLERVLTVERNVEIMVLEQYLLPDNFVCLLRMRMFLQCLLGQKLEALAYLDVLLNTFRLRTSDRHTFLREHIQELYITVLQMQLASTAQNCVISNGLLISKVFAALAEFPRNLFLLQRCGMLNAAPWYKLRAAVLRNNPTILSIIILIAAARYRFIQSTSAQTATSSNLFHPLNSSIVTSDRHHVELIVRNRILNLFRKLIPTSKDQEGQSLQYKALQRNALVWRLYLRCLSDQRTAFETSNNCLLMALDACPWSKSLYMDGATYVPQELTRLQDLMFEKDLRVCALTEELEVMRDNDIHE